MREASLRRRRAAATDIGAVIVVLISRRLEYLLFRKRLVDHHIKLACALPRRICASIAPGGGDG
jgi:hypothetical protein